MISKTAHKANDGKINIVWLLSLGLAAKVNDRAING